MQPRSAALNELKYVLGEDLRSCGLVGVVAKAAEFATEVQGKDTLPRPWPPSPESRPSPCGGSSPGRGRGRSGRRPSARPGERQRREPRRLPGGSHEARCMASLRRWPQRPLQLSSSAHRTNEGRLASRPDVRSISRRGVVLANYWHCVGAPTGSVLGEIPERSRPMTDLSLRRLTRTVAGFRIGWRLAMTPRLVGCLCLGLVASPSWIRADPGRHVDGGGAIAYVSP
jgi:hypothetical protein